MHKPETKEKLALPEAVHKPYPNIPRHPSRLNQAQGMGVTAMGCGDGSREAVVAWQGPATRVGSSTQKQHCCVLEIPPLDCSAVALNSAPGTCGHEQEF